MPFSSCEAMEQLGLAVVPIQKGSLLTSKYIARNWTSRYSPSSGTRTSTR